MIAFKGFSEELHSVMGNRDRETCTFKPGDIKTVEESKTANCGFHCCEYPFHCLAYYSMNGKNRFFKVDARGDIDEDEHNRIACTQIELIEELDAYKLAYYAMEYMIRHPNRSGWEVDDRTVQVKRDSAHAKAAGQIAIARGENPTASGPEGSVIGLIWEDTEGIRLAKLLRVHEDMAGVEIRINEERKVVRA